MSKIIGGLTHPFRLPLVLLEAITEGELPPRGVVCKDSMLCSLVSLLSLPVSGTDTANGMSSSFSSSVSVRSITTSGSAFLGESETRNKEFIFGGNNLHGDIKCCLSISRSEDNLYKRIMTAISGYIL